MTEALQDLADYVVTACGDALLSHEIRRGELTVLVKRDELPRVRLAQRMIEILERLQHPRLAPAVLDAAESLEGLHPDRRIG